MRNTIWLPPICTPTRDQTWNPGMYPTWESNQQHFALWDNAQSIEPHGSGGGCFFVFFFFFKILFIYPLREGKGGRKKGRATSYGRDTSICCLSHAPTWGPGPQPRNVPWLGIELVTLWFLGQHSIHWATPARASFWNKWLIFALGNPRQLFLCI